jgi:hypothetical protein
VGGGTVSPGTADVTRQRVPLLTTVPPAHQEARGHHAGEGVPGGAGDENFQYGLDHILNVLKTRTAHGPNARTPTPPNPLG